LICLIHFIHSQAPEALDNIDARPRPQPVKGVTMGLSHQSDPSAPSALFTALLITSFLSGCATYSHDPEPVPAMNPAERSARADELFTMLDTNGDGYLTRDEMQSGLRYTTQADAPATRSLMLDKSAPESEEKKYKHKKLTDDEIAKLVEEAFVKRVDHSVDAVSK